MVELLVRRLHTEREGYTTARTAIPSNVLEKIVWHKELEIQTDRDISRLERLPVRDFIGSLRCSPYQPGLIAEVKRGSPSKGVIRENFDPVAIATAYEEGGARAISVLTDREFFGGSFEYLGQVKGAVSLPVLCKEFIIDRVQLDWARAFGADAVLLIVAILSDYDLQDLWDYAQELGMQVLVEVHTIGELQRVLSLAGILAGLRAGRGAIGVNNRDLRDFTVNLQTTIEVINSVDRELRESLFWVSESGLFTRADLDLVQAAGAKAVLVGESLVKQSDIRQAVVRLLQG
ncbi:MAG: indole-3-glycerol phosphate synthase TrpC [Pseudanabaenaceae cyanobacterium SKYGB_i_bin29]|nr:indole-3-glycerol phosphate synthase TrpC [Pseudanabaenaceae cyanobacterium SKYG29]MDW8421524.1 indole-3-glycerol phosphate synthase TrpC [Pseudanabaenaceae cyanobacterium SKYGB_i_bin29]